MEGLGLPRRFSKTFGALFAISSGCCSAYCIGRLCDSIRCSGRRLRKIEDALTKHTIPMGLAKATVVNAAYLHFAVLYQELLKSLRRRNALEPDRQT